MQKRKAKVKGQDSPRYARAFQNQSRSHMTLERLQCMVSKEIESATSLDQRCDVGEQTAMLTNLKEEEDTSKAILHSVRFVKVGCSRMGVNFINDDKQR